MDSSYTNDQLLYEKLLCFHSRELLRAHGFVCEGGCLLDCCTV
jgi:hypothetical protein